MEARFFVTAEIPALGPTHGGGTFRTYDAARNLAETWKRVHEEGCFNIKIHRVDDWAKFCHLLNANSSWSTEENTR